MLMVKFVPKRDAPVVKGENLYAAECAQSTTGEYVPVEGFAVRARNAYEAERKFLFCLEEGLRGKTVDYNLEAALAERAKKGKEAEDERGTAEGAP